jgi:hypothetical protein
MSVDIFEKGDNYFQANFEVGIQLEVGVTNERGACRVTTRPAFRGTVPTA